LTAPFLGDPLEGEEDQLPPGGRGRGKRKDADVD